MIETTVDRSAIEFSTENLSVRFYQRDSQRVVVAFASAGAKRVDGFAEEFHGSLRATGVSIVFVTDRRVRWYNYPETAEILGRVAAIVAPFAHIAALGESHGGSGALLFARFCPALDRILAFSPQFSIAPPFVYFDRRYAALHAGIGKILYPAFAEPAAVSKAVILYGNRDWQDHLHGAMFQAAGFSLGYIRDAVHAVAAFVKTSAPGGLIAIMQAFCDFSRPFDRQALYAIAGIGWSDLPLQPGYRLGEILERELEFAAHQANRVACPQTSLPLISRGCAATQSSVCQFSLGTTPEADAARAVSGDFSGDYAFHTDGELRPWWRVDLGAKAAIGQIRIFNRIASPATAERAYRFDLQISDDDAAWTTIYVKDNDGYVGGGDGRPYIIAPPPGLSARFVKIQLLTWNCLHLDQVEIYGAAP